MAGRGSIDGNSLRLIFIFAANIVLLYTIVAAPSFLQSDFIVEAIKALGKIVPAGLGAALVGILNAQLDQKTKARLVFLRWHNPLPSARAFTEHGPNDGRIDMKGLRTRLGRLPTAPDRQNAVWYQLYREVAQKPPVLHANKEYLFARDYHVLSLGMLVVLGFASVWVIEVPSTRWYYLGGLFLQFLLTGQAARIQGRRLVCNVLAQSTPLAPKSRKTEK